jgi:hypothetical protein
VKPSRLAPQWLYWTGLALAFAVLYARLAAAPESTLAFWFNSDYLFAADIYKDVVVDGFPLSGIKFSIAPCLFPDVVVTAVLMFLTRNAVMATFFYGIFQFTLLVTAYVFLSAVVRGRERPSPNGCILAAAVVLVLHTSRILSRNYDTMYYLFLDESHLSNFALAIICGGASLWLCFHSWREGRAHVMLSVTAVLSVLGTISDLMFVPHMLVALTVAVAILRFLDLLPPGRPWYVLLVLCAGAFLGVVLVRACFDTATLGSQAVATIDRFTIALNTYVKGMLVKGANGDGLHLAAAFWIVSAAAVILYLIRRHIVQRVQCGEMPEPTRRLALAVLFLVISAVGSALSIIVMGVAGLSEFKDYSWSMHYQYPLFFGAIFGLALLADVALAYLPASLLRVRWLPASACVFVPSVMLFMSPRPPSPLHAYNPPLVQALDALAPQYGLRYGVGGFWQARGVNMFSKAGLRLYPIGSNLEPLHWLGNKYWYAGYPGSRYPHPVYNYIVLDDPLFKIPREAVVARFGEPAAELKAYATRVLVYNRPSDHRFRNFFTCSAMLASILHPLERAGDRLELAGACLPGLVGGAEGDARVARQGKTASGFLSFGPYLGLKPGGYEASIRCQTAGAAGQTEADWDLGFFSVAAPVAIGRGSVRTGETEIRAPFSISERNTGLPLEMRVIYKGTGDIMIEKLTIERTR